MHLASNLFIKHIHYVLMYILESTSVTQTQSVPEEEEPEEEEQDDDDTLPDLTGFVVDDMKQYVGTD